MLQAHVRGHLGQESHFLQEGCTSSHILELELTKYLRRQKLAEGRSLLEGAGVREDAQLRSQEPFREVRARIVAEEAGGWTGPGRAGLEATRGV